MTEDQYLCKAYAAAKRVVAQMKFRNADDAIQEAVVVAWRKRNQITAASDPTAAICQCLRWAVMDWLRANTIRSDRRQFREVAVDFHQHAVNEEDDYVRQEPPAKAEDPADVLATEELRQDFSRWLTRRELTIFEGRLRGDTLKDIGDQIGISESRVCQYVRRLRVFYRTYDSGGQPRPILA